MIFRSGVLLVALFAGSLVSHAQIIITGQSIPRGPGSTNDPDAPLEARQGIEVGLVVRKGDDLAAIAEKYAGEREGAASGIERLLRARLGRAESVVIPLQRVLHPFIREFHGKYAHQDGPNCFNAAWNVNHGTAYKLEELFGGNRALLAKLYAAYRFVQPGEELQVGDYLLYLDLSGEPLHAATFVGDGIAFTKNGAKRGAPYIFQKLETVLQVYPRAMYMQALRMPRQAGFEKANYWQSAEAEYGWLKFDASAGVDAQRSRLADLSRYMLSDFQLENLERLRKDARVVALKDELEALYARNLRYQKDRDLFRAIGFDPFEDRARNVAVLASVTDTVSYWAEVKAALARLATYPELVAEYRTELEALDARFGLGLELDGKPESCRIIRPF